jgi:hypothetical protein
MAKRRRITQRSIIKIHNLRGRGYSGPAIAKATDRSLPTIYKILASKPLMPKRFAKKASTGELNSAIRAVVKREVDAKIAEIRAAVLKAFEI